MDGTYGNIFPASRAMSPAAPAQTSTSNLYKVNVNRQKTKKWANFKPQNYDGDDWGDDYDDPVQEADFPMPPKPLGPRSPATTAPVQPSVSSALPRGSAEPFGSSPQQHGSGLGRPRFPSDKSTIGANDVAGGYGAALESGAGSKPWMGSRSVSPSSPGQLSSRDKPLPLIHPQQMQEEKEGERQSLETRDNTKNDEGEPPGVSSPTAEKQSGYRSDGMLASSGKDRLNPESSRAEHEKSQESVLPDSPQNIRRFSTSPQLPDLSRMSGFGEDLFSSAFFPSSGLRSSLSDSMPLPTSGNCIPESDEATATAAGASNQSITAPARERVVSSTETTTAAGAEAAPSPPSDRDQDQGRPAGLPSPRGAAESVHDVPEQQAPAADAARQPAASAEEQPTTLTARPHLPGGWVSETPSTPAGVVSPSTTGYSTNTLEKATEDSSRPDAVPLGVPRSQPRELEQDEKGDGSVPSRQTSPQTSSQPPAPAPVLNTEKLSMGSAQASPVATGHCDASPASETEDPKLFGNSTSAEAKTKHTEIAPTAPLNARRGTPDINANPAPVLSPPSPAEPVLDSATQSPVKDSDILSEEILRSLSPAQPASSPQTSTAAYQAAAAEPVRESSYLGDVYGDYWSATEEKAEPGLLQVGKTIDAGKAAQEAAPLPTKTPEDGGAAEPADAVGLGGLSSQAHAAPAKASDVVEPKSAFGVVGLQRRFSWEAPVQESPTASASSAAAELPVEQKSLGFGVDTTRALTTENISLETGESQPSQAQEEAGKSAEDLRAEFAPEFNPAATLGANLGLDRPSQSPSPASDSTSKHGEQKRLSLAEEKILLEEASSPSSRSPPLEQHPAFANSQQAPRAELPEAASPKSILGFRNIMELPSAAERIKHYNESRWHFSAVDTGLDEWLQAMILKHPEHANDVSSNAGAAAVVQQSSQGGRGPTLHMSNLQHSLSGLGHSGNQVGTKSKELLMAAGKASKGLFSKGRNKLRGTGDKVFSS
ncbi:hypothetical protein MYCTH_2310892 [Thermothelomyces thermophilus ATCC 42464]|uniref:Uncharacterized protein n=1 Tax=Thermothelomyces thermophilus (strain ATCC 42464 / BCRC 31852 / DSM 1799) TaxID=573729 RepID=G2QM89_THET4|nr:uncharacterized protein MYCTH_2310892 [Thermothelomyces thermophilus ATCC 42464]AEO61069.1 hypothetical protein MYCTH_2310892 [Thermothelomyces thermophilus ATCC 42464]